MQSTPASSLLNKSFHLFKVRLMTKKSNYRKYRIIQTKSSSSLFKAHKLKSCIIKRKMSVKPKTFRTWSISKMATTAQKQMKCNKAMSKLYA